MLDGGKRLFPRAMRAKNTTLVAQRQGLNILIRTIPLIPRFAPTDGAIWGTLT
jgi:hypothetical protein